MTISRYRRLRTLELMMRTKQAHLRKDDRTPFEAWVDDCRKDATASADVPPGPGCCGNLGLGVHPGVFAQAMEQLNKKGE